MLKFIILGLAFTLSVNSYRLPLYKLSPATQITSEQNGNLVDLAQSLGLTSLIAAAEKVKIASVLENAPALTLFGPTNEGFDRVPEPIKPLLANDTILRLFLFFHVLKGDVFASAIKNELLVPTILETKPKLSIRFNIYENDGVGKVVTAQCSKIIKVNQNASNGVIHVVENVMIPANETIAGIVTTYKQYYSTLLLALQKAQLDVVLSGDGPFTVFAPTNGAFAKIDPEKLKKILADIELLTKILKYHVVAGTQCSAGLYSGQKVPTLEGSDVSVHFAPGAVYVNNARVVYVDATATNGVIHTIDTVLIPPGLEL